MKKLAIVTNFVCVVLATAPVWSDCDNPPDCDPCDTRDANCNCVPPNKNCGFREHWEGYPECRCVDDPFGWQCDNAGEYPESDCTVYCVTQDDPCTEEGCIINNTAASSDSCVKTYTNPNSTCQTTPFSYSVTWKECKTYQNWRRITAECVDKQTETGTIDRC